MDPKHSKMCFLMFTSSKMSQTDLSVQSVSAAALKANKLETSIKQKVLTTFSILLPLLVTNFDSQQTPLSLVNLFQTVLVGGARSL